ncbi:PIN2/TERF1-interacting telomerase inhibitor 1 [Salminus brasiliensis]|uniref:PIN2/TERF1-interacting telomerase inhibitor 1 n=1 Tax=Salminus brasiliensis TaxID=930266 RepID=UPI003B82E67A
MSMLAEPRRRQKWSVDPRNSAWSKDESKFGQKMLERMGWSKGKGLGKSEQGATDHIKVKVKNNSLGLGAAVYNEDNWIAHQDDFNQLLADLNNCHGQSNTEDATQEQTQGFSLEEKSKTSRKRVHYMKFTKGKDLSNRSETDLACIFGKRSKKTRDQDEGSSGPDSQEEKEQDNNEEDKDQPSNTELELNTVTSTLTMQEYFAQRMAQLKKGQSAAYSPAASSKPQSPSAPSASTEDSPNTSDVEQSRKKKKKKKRKDDGQEDEEKVKETEELHLTEVVDTEQDPSERKKKKKKKREAREDTAEECSVPTAVDNSSGDIAALSTHKKKKNKKNKLKGKEEPTQTPTDSANEHDATENVMDTELSDKKKKKRKRREHLEQLDEQAEEVVEKKKPKKDKKRKKSDN